MTETNFEENQTFTPEQDTFENNNNLNEALQGNDLNGDNETNSAINSEPETSGIAGINSGIDTNNGMTAPETSNTAVSGSQADPSFGQQGDVGANLGNENNTANANLQMQENNIAATPATAVSGTESKVSGQSEKTGLSSVPDSEQAASAMSANVDMSDELFGKSTEASNNQEEDSGHTVIDKTNATATGSSSIGVANGLSDDIFATQQTTEKKQVSESTVVQPEESGNKAIEQSQKPAEETTEQSEYHVKGVNGEEIPLSAEAIAGYDRDDIKSILERWEPEYAEMGLTGDDLFLKGQEFYDKVKTVVDTMAEKIEGQYGKEKFLEYADAVFDQPYDQSSIYEIKAAAYNRLEIMHSLAGRENDFVSILNYVEYNIADENTSKARVMKLIEMHHTATRVERNLKLGFKQEDVLDIDAGQKTGKIGGFIRVEKGSDRIYKSDLNDAGKSGRIKRYKEMLSHKEGFSSQEYLDANIKDWVEKATVSEKVMETFTKSKESGLAQSKKFDIAKEVSTKDIVDAVNEHNDGDALDIEEMRKAHLFDKINNTRIRGPRLSKEEEAKKISGKTSRLKSVAVFETALEIGFSEKAEFKKLIKENILDKKESEPGKKKAENKKLTLGNLYKDILLNKDFHGDEANAQDIANINDVYSQKLFDIFEDSIRAPLDKVDSCNVEHANRDASRRVNRVNYLSGSKDGVFESMSEDTFFANADNMGKLQAKKSEFQIVDKNSIVSFGDKERQNYLRTIRTEYDQNKKEFFKKYGDDLGGNEDKYNKAMDYSVGLNHRTDDTLHEEVQEQLKIFMVGQMLEKMGGAKAYLGKQEQVPNLEDVADIKAAKNDAYKAFYAK